MTKKPNYDLYKRREIMLSKALAFLTTKPRTLDEVRRRLAYYLSKTSYKKEDIQSYVEDRLVEMGLIDDAAYVTQYIKETMRAGKLDSPIKIRTFLMRKGVDRSLIDEALSTIPVGSAKEKISQLAEKKLRTLKDTDKRKKKQKLITFIIRKGFSYDQTRAVVDALLDVK